MNEPDAADPAQSIPSLGRWTLIWAAGAYALLGVAAAICLLDAGQPWRTRIGACALGGLWGLWYWLLVARRRPARASVAVRVASFLLSLGVAAAASWMHPAYALLLFSYYGLAFSELPVAWAVPTVLLTSVALAARFMLLRGDGTPARNLAILAGFAGMAVVDILLGLFVGSIVRRTQERDRMIRELERARVELARAEREAGMLQERQRLAGEIHDTLAQGFASVILQLESARSGLNADPGRASGHVERALEVARASLAEARRVLWALRPDLLEGEPFIVSLEAVARSWSDESGIPAEIRSTGTPLPVPAAAKVALTSVVREALANVRKHARASRVSVTLSYMDSELVMDVQDDGQGFSGDGAPTGGYGLVAARERMQQIGGVLTVESAPGEGCTVVAQVPLGAGAGSEGAT